MAMSFTVIMKNTMFNVYFGYTSYVCVLGNLVYLDDNGSVCMSKQFLGM